jgi:glycerol transport system ATP-binding protein
MNLLPCSVDGNLAVLDCGSIPLDPAVAAKAGHGELGSASARCTSNSPTTPAREPWPDAIVSVEFEGSSSIVTVESGCSKLKVRVPEGRSIPSDSCWVVFPPERTKLFRDQ